MLRAKVIARICSTIERSGIEMEYPYGDLSSDNASIAAYYDMPLIPVNTTYETARNIKLFPSSYGEMDARERLKRGREENTERETKEGRRGAPLSLLAEPNTKNTKWSRHPANFDEIASTINTRGITCRLH